MKDIQNAVLVGNPNVGKTTLFNQLTGRNLKVGNWSGVTVEKKSGQIKNSSIELIDLPGIYSLDAANNEEIIAEQFLKSDQYDVIINIVNASNLERNLYLTMELLRLKKPMILLLNMADVLAKKGLSINIPLLSERLGIPVFAIQANQPKTFSDFIVTMKSQVSVNNIIIPDFADQKAAYDYIENILLPNMVIREKDDKHSKTTAFLDRLFFHPVLSFLSLAVVIWLIFQITFEWVGGPLGDWIGTGLEEVVLPWVLSLMPWASDWFVSLISEGIFGGLGTILAALPVIVILYVCLTFLEDFGYMPRVAVLLDRAFSKIGLSGKAIIPMIMGFGCAVPAVLSTRNLDTEREQKLTTLLLPFMSCNARLPVYVLFASAFFSGQFIFNIGPIPISISQEGLVVASLYILGVIVAIIIALILKNTAFKGAVEHFLVELPEYHFPSIKTLSINTWQKVKSYLKKAATFILLASLVIWLLSHISFTGYTEDMSASILANIGSIFAPLFSPLGFGDWQSAVSIISGFVAKETVISTMGVLYSGSEELLAGALSAHFTTLSAYAFLVFVLLYTPCVAVIGAVRQEYGLKYAWIVALYPIAVAWIVCFVIYQGGLLLSHLF